MQFAPVSPPAPAQAPARSLVTSALTPSSDGARWENGIAWRPERCPQGRLFDPCDDATGFGPLVGEGDEGVVYYVPSPLRVEDRCSTRYGDSNDDQARVRRQLEGTTSWFLARELWSGDWTRTHSYTDPEGTAGVVNAYLADESRVTVHAGSRTPSEALGFLEEATRDAALGMDVVLHVPVEVVPHIAHALVLDGNLLKTMTGARVIADAGYPGTGPFDTGTAEVQNVAITGGPTGGTFTLTYSGQTTGPIAFNATAGAVQTALIALSNIAPGDLAVTGGPGPGTAYVVTWNVALGNVAQMTGSGALLTGGTAPAVAVTTTTAGVAPAVAAGLWMYGTGPVAVRLSPIVTEELINHRENLRLVTAERMGAAYFDPCIVHGLTVTLPEPTP